MGWCHEFGPQIQDGCSHPMVAGATSCTCAQCGAVCTGRFNGCPAVWARGPVAAKSKATHEPVALAQASSDRVLANDLPAPDFTLRTIPVPEVALAPIEPLRVKAPPPVAASAPTPAVVPARRRLPPAPPPVVRVPRERPPRKPGLPGVRERLDDLQVELKSLGTTLEYRVARSRDWA